MKNKYAYLLLFLLLALSKISAQTATLRGIVLDENATPILGASVSYSNDGTTTNENGFYLLSIPADQDIAVTISYIGLEKAMQTFNLKPNSNFEFNPVLRTDIQQLGLSLIHI